MLAIVKIAGKQFKITMNQEIRVPLLKTAVGKKVKFDDVFYYSDEKVDHIGKPNLKGALVTATVLEHNREKKILIYKKKRRKGYQRKNGHRQWYSKIKIESILLSNQKKSVSKQKKSKTDKKANGKEKEV